MSGLDWDREAESLLGRVPVFVRPLVRRKVEEFAGRLGAPRVTAEVVRQAHEAFGVRGADAKASDADAALPPGLIERLEAEAEALAHSPDFRTPHYRVHPCGGAVGCPRALIPVRETAEALGRAIVASGFPAFLERGLHGKPLLSHHRLQLAVSGCPNACSQPQIRDFGIIGKTAVIVSADLCDGCLRCVEACREGAIRVADSVPGIDLGRCIGCGDCVRVCPTGALSLGAPGYVVVAGGRLGRHPRLAQQLAIARDLPGVLDALGSALRALMEMNKPGERLAAVIEAKGAAALGVTDA